MVRIIIKGDSCSFNANIPISVDDKRNRYKVYIEQIIIEGARSEKKAFLTIHSINLTQSSTIYSSGVQNSILAIVPSHATLDDFYLLEKKNSIPDFEISSINQILDFTIRNSDGLVPSTNHITTIVLLLVKID